jgi:RNA recognition motif-containing protein
MYRPTWLFFDGLSKNFFSALLIDLCGTYGKVLSANTFVDGDGSCLGSGYVEMETMEAAEQAVEELDGSLVLGQVIRVYVIRLP